MTTIPSTATDTVVKTAQPVADAATWSELVKTLDGTDGIALVPMETLRKLEGAQRLGVHVLNAIGARLGTLGIGHLPEALPNRQDQEAILYRYGTSASEVISAVRNGVRSAQDVQNTYRALHKLNTTPEPTQVVHRAEMEDKLTTATQAMLDLLGDSSNRLLNRNSR